MTAYKDLGITSMRSYIDIKENKPSTKFAASMETMEQINLFPEMG